MRAQTGEAVESIFYVLGIMFSFVSVFDLNETQLHFRWSLATAIASGTSDPVEQRVLTRIAWYEGNFRQSVAECKRKGDRGKSHGSFQIQPRSAEEKRLACGTLDEQVALALVYIRRSRALCAHLPERDQLSLYTTGRCMNNREAQLRWDAPEKAKVIPLPRREDEPGAPIAEASGW